MLQPQSSSSSCQTLPCNRFGVLFTHLNLCCVSMLLCVCCSEREKMLIISALSFLVIFFFSK